MKDGQKFAGAKNIKTSERSKTRSFNCHFGFRNVSLLNKPSLVFEILFQIHLVFL